VPSAHETHASIELAAAAVLTLGGAVVLGRAWVDRRPAARAGRPSGGAADSVGDPIDPALRRLIVILSGAAAAIHLAAAPAHIVALGDVGLAFYWAALFQAGFAVAFLPQRPAGWLATLGIVGNGVLVIVWGASRTVGLPVLGIGPEPIGIADGVAVALELGIVGLLALTGRGVGTRVAAIAGPDTARTAATSGLVAVAGVAMLATTVALGQPGTGHDHGTAAGHPAPSVVSR
jgi:hypothetical protein